MGIYYINLFIMGKSRSQKVNWYELCEEDIDNEWKIHNSRCLGILYCPYCNRKERERVMNMRITPP
jgi:hypothetical protein